MLGKGDARTFMSLINSMLQAMGLDSYALQETASEILHKNKLELEAKKKIVANNQERFLKKMQPTFRQPQSGKWEGFDLCTYSNFYCFDVNVQSCELGECLENYVYTGTFTCKKRKLKATQSNGQIRVACRACRRIHGASFEQVRRYKPSALQPYATCLREMTNRPSR